MTQRKVSEFSDKELAEHAMALKGTYSLKTTEDVFDPEECKVFKEQVKQDVGEIIGRMYSANAEVSNKARTRLVSWLTQISNQFIDKPKDDGTS